MASFQVDKDTSEIIALYKIVSKNATVRLSAKLAGYQDVFSEEDIKKMNRQEVIYHVIHLRRLSGQSGPVKKHVDDFKPTTFKEDPSLKALDALPTGEASSGATTPTTIAPPQNIIAQDPMTMFTQMLMLMEEKRVAREEQKEERHRKEKIEQEERLRKEKIE